MKPMTNERPTEIAKAADRLYEGWTAEAADIPDDIYDEVMEEYRLRLLRDEARQQMEYGEMVDGLPKGGPLADFVPRLVEHAEACGNIPVQFLGGRFAIDRRGNWLSSGGDTWLPSSLDEILDAASLDVLVEEFEEILCEVP